MSRRLTARGRVRRRQLMDYAARKFAENGYHATSVSEIVEGMAVGKSVFYWYFPSKEELFAEILRDGLRQLRRQQATAIGDEPDAVRRIELGLLASLTWFTDNRHLFNLFQFAQADDVFREIIVSGERVAADDVARHLEEGMAEGRLSSGDPALIAQALLGITNQLARTYIYERAADSGTVAKEAIAFIELGLRGESRR